MGFPRFPKAIRSIVDDTTYSYILPKETLENIKRQMKNSNK